MGARAWILGGSLVCWSCAGPADAPIEAAPGPACDPLARAGAWSRWTAPVARSEELDAAERDREALALGEALAGREAEAAGRALGRLGDLRAAQALAEAFDRAAHPDRGVALGLALVEAVPGGHALEERLWAHYALAEDPELGSALLFALGRHGGARSMRGLAGEWIAAPREQGLRALDAAVLACDRGVELPATALPALTQALDEAALAAAAARVVARCTPSSGEALAGEARAPVVAALLAAIAAPDPEVRRAAWAALAQLGEIPQAIPDDVLTDRSPWQVNVEAARALAGVAEGRRFLVDRLVSLGPPMGSAVHVARAALVELRGRVGAEPELLPELRPLQRSIADERRRLDDPRAQRGLALVACDLALLEAIVTRRFEPVLACNAGAPGLPETYGAVLAVEGMVRVGATAELLRAAADPRPAVAQAALAALADVDDARVAERLRAAVLHPDLGVRTAAVSAIAARAVEVTRRDLTAVPLLVALAEGPALEVRLLALEALGALARSPGGSGATDDAPWLRSTVLPLAVDEHAAVRAAARGALRDAELLRALFDTLVWLAPRRREAATAPEESAGMLRVITEAGTFDIELARQDAPVSAAHFARLARAGFYDGTSIHRVVPGFAVQGGDPRGDGYGGTEGSMPSERSDLRFERGVVGLAEVGRDSVGSQFFVTLARAPHLDGRHTVVGRVPAEDLPVVEAILPFDRVERVEVR